MFEKFLGRKRDIAAEYQELHRKGQEILGSLYSKKKFDSVMGSFINDDASFRQSFELLENNVNAAKSEAEKDQVRQAWLDENDVLGKIGLNRESEKRSLNNSISFSILLPGNPGIK